MRLCAGFRTELTVLKKANVQNALVQGTYAYS